MTTLKKAKIAATRAPAGTQGTAKAGNPQAGTTKRRTSKTETKKQRELKGTKRAKKSNGAGPKRAISRELRMTQKEATKKTKNTRQGTEQQTENHPGMFFGIGSGLNWESPVQKVALRVELPFWLLMEPGTYKVSADDFTSEIQVDNDAIEVQRGGQFSRTHRDTLFIGGRHEALTACIEPARLFNGSIVRPTRTLLTFEAPAIQDAIEAFFGDDKRRYQDGHRYFASLAAGHLGVINALINAYRRASIDPFANEITIWDVPTWFILTAKGHLPICLNSFLSEDWFPTISIGKKGKKKDVRYVAANAKDVREFISKEEAPGEIEMLDGWSLFHRGRHADSIRSFVTAIEVLVESEIRRLLMNAGNDDETVTQRLESTRNNFDNRLADYCVLTKTRIPGPILHFVPYITGTRLWDELTQTRKLRHKIVHHGHRLDHNFLKPMLRAAETTSWLYNWISNKHDFEERRTKHSTFFFGIRTNALTFDCRSIDGQPTVVPPYFLELNDIPEVRENTIIVEKGHVIYSKKMLIDTISTGKKNGKDLELFVKLAFYELGMGEIRDSAYSTTPSNTTERFFVNLGTIDYPIFIIDSDKGISQSDIDTISDQLTQRRENKERIGRGVIILNSNKHLHWTKRESNIPSHIIEKAHSSGLSIINVASLAKMVLGVRYYNWSREKVKSELFQGGCPQLTVPASTLLGFIYKTWRKEESAIIGLQMPSTRRLRSKLLVAIDLPDGFHQEEITSPLIDSNHRLTYQTTFKGKNIPIGSKVFTLKSRASFNAANDKYEHQLPEFHKAYISKFAHPND